MATRMQQRRGTAAQWISTNSGNGPILAIGEIGYESDTNKFKIGDGVNHWLNLSYFVDLATTIAGAPGLLNSLDEIAAAIGDDPAFFTTVATNLSNHQADSTAIHGIADTSLLVTTTGTQTLTNKTITSPSGLVKGDVGLGSVDNTTDANKPVSTATQTALDLKANSSDITELAQDAVNTAIVAGTGLDKTYDDAANTITIDIDSTVVTKTGTEILTNKTLNLPIINTPTGLVKSDVGLSDVDNTSDVDKPISYDTQTALDAKLAAATAASTYAPLASPAFTGTVTGITKSMIELGSVDDTSDANKPISDATSVALGLKAPKASPTFTGTITAENIVATDLVVNGNLTVNSGEFLTSATSITVEDNLLQLAHQNAANTVDLGLVVAYNDGAAKHSGIVRDVSSDRWKLFKGVTTEPTTTVDFTEGSLDNLQVNSIIADSLLIGDVDNTEFNYLSGVTSAIQTQLNAKLASATAASTYATIASPTFTGTVSGITKSMVGLGSVDNTTDGDKPVSTAQASAISTAKSEAITDAGTAAGTAISTAVAALTKSSVGLGSVDNTADADKPVSNDTQTALDLKAPLASPTFTGTVSGITKSMVDLGSVDNTSDAGKPISTDTQTALDLKAPLASPTFTGTVSGVTKSHVGLAAVDNTADSEKPISTATQTALDAKLASATAASTYAPLASPTFTGTVAGITSTMVGLANVDNTADAAKPVSTATQTALDLKANLASPTFTGTVTLPTGTVTSGMILDGAIVNADINASAAIAQSKISDLTSDLAAKLALSGGTMTGALTLSGAPTSDLHAATKLYVDNVTAGINFHESVHAASVSSLATNYANGTSGLGATLTADTNRAFSTLDGESVVVGERVLIKNQTDAKQNGIYTLTTAGSVSVPWVLTRATDADNNPTGEMKTGDFTFVQRGTVNASVGYINNSTANPIVIGTDNISYTEFNAGKTVVAGSGLTEATPGIISVETGGVTSAMIADGAIVDADVNASAAIAQSKISGLTSDLAAKAPTASPTFTGTVTVAAAGVAFTDGTQTKEGVPSRTTFSQKTASYTLSSLTERDSMIEMGSASAITLTVPTNATVAWPVGTSIDILQTGAGQVTVAGAGGVTVNATPGLKLRAQWSSATLIKRATDTWVLVGDLSA